METVKVSSVWWIMGMSRFDKMAVIFSNGISLPMRRVTNSFLMGMVGATYGLG